MERTDDHSDLLPVLKSLSRMGLVDEPREKARALARCLAALPKLFDKLAAMPDPAAALREFGEVGEVRRLCQELGETRVRPRGVGYFPHAATCARRRS